MYKLWEALSEAKKLKWVELSHSLNNDSPYWSGIPEGSVELCKVVFDWGNPMLDCRIHTFKFFRATLTRTVCFRKRLT